MSLKIKFRESFRPFAPSVLREKAAEYFDLDGESPYMLLVAPVKKTQRRELTAEDVAPIARGQIAEEDAAAAAARAREARCVVLDTDLLSTVAYARHYYGGCPGWIEREAKARRGDLYLLCHPDVPWSLDGVRDRPARREEIHALFEAVLAEAGAPVIHLEGPWSERDALRSTPSRIGP